VSQPGVLRPGCYVPRPDVKVAERIPYGLWLSDCEWSAEDETKVPPLAARPTYGTPLPLPYAIKVWLLALLVRVNVFRPTPKKKKFRTCAICIQENFVTVTLWVPQDRVKPTHLTFRKLANSGSTRLSRKKFDLSRLSAKLV